MRSLAFIPVMERPLAMDVQALPNSRVSVQRGGAKDVTIGDDGMLRLQGRICVPNVDGLWELILEEAHSLRYSIHRGATKMYHDLKQHNWRWRMKKDIVGYVAQCLNFQQVKYEHSRPGGLLQRLLGTNLVHDALEKVKLIQEWLRTAQTKKKIYVDRKARDVPLMVGEKVLLSVSPIKDVMRFGKKVKLSPWYIGPFELLERVGEVAYRLSLPYGLSVYSLFHVSMLQKYFEDLSHVLDFSSVQLDKDLAYVEEPVAILDKQVRNLRQKNIA
ncbi:uncharacterized protein [Nicotiana tomentosiformis]|uniref:uncharacterized protein n=1 Tax=Nicotiana tomentosiformis TaxID=4098 RepID=UPI00388C4F39